MRTHDKGDLVRVTGTFTQSTTVLDPTTVLFSFSKPDGTTTTTYVYTTNTQLVKDSTGIYHVDLNADQSGVWYYRFFSQGTGQAAQEGEFTVAKSNF